MSEADLDIEERLLRERLAKLLMVEEEAVVSPAEDNEELTIKLEGQPLINEPDGNNFRPVLLESTADEERIDITEQFYNICSRIPIGSLEKHESFYLFEAMSAIELMDPKMDIGMVRFQKKMGLDVCIEKGVFKCDLPTTLSMIDATLSAFVTWLEGNSIAQTLWTNVLIASVPEVKDPIWEPIGDAFAFIVQSVEHIVQTAAVFDEEDFNTHLPYRIQSTRSPQQIIDYLTQSEITLTKDAKLASKTNSDDKHVLTAIAARLGWLRALIQSIIYLIPPKNVEQPAADDEPPCFRPKLRQGTEALQACASYIKIINATWKLGSRPENIEEDGDFAWLPAFEPEYNRKHLPPTFPRKSEMYPRSKALPYLSKMSESLLRIPIELPGVVHDLDEILQYLKAFSENESTVFTRAVLQLVMLPNDDRIFGEVPISEIFLETLKNSVAPTMLSEESLSYDDGDTQASLSDFVGDAVRVFLNIIQVYGSNLARQRDKIVAPLEDMNTLHSEADKTDGYSHAAEDKDGLTPTGPALSTYILNKTMQLVLNHFELSFRLDLIAPYEYTYTYWYLGEIVLKWTNNAADRAQTMVINDFKKSVPADDNNKKIDKKKALKLAKREDKLRKRLNSVHASIAIQTAQCMMCDAMFRATIGLSLLKKIKMPMWNAESEAIRFAHRMTPFAGLGLPVHISYSQFKNISRIDELTLAGYAQCLNDAGEAFEMARVQLERIEKHVDAGEQAKSLMRICRNNTVVCRIMASGQRQEDINFDFTPDWPMFPLLKMFNK